MTEINVQHLELILSPTEKYTLSGQCIAGIISQVSINELDICFDMGFCSDMSVRQKNVLITHGHSFIRNIQKHTIPTYITHRFI